MWPHLGDNRFFFFFFKMGRNQSWGHEGTSCACQQRTDTDSKMIVDILNGYTLHEEWGILSFIHDILIPWEFRNVNQH